MAASNPKEIRIMAVGPSGVGKSTIGNRLLNLKSKDSNYLETSSSTQGVTTEPKTINSGHMFYTDVPGIPDPKPENTKKYYDKIIKEAKKKCTAIFIIFSVDMRMDSHTKERIEDCSLLFDEISKSSALKILILNDMKAQWPNPDELDENDDNDKKAYLAGKAEYDKEREKGHEAYGKEIRETTRINFNSTVVLYGLSKKYSPDKNMTDVLKNLKETLRKSGIEPVTSEHLRSFEELKKSAMKASKDKNYAEKLKEDQQKVIKRLEGEYAICKERYDSFVGVQQFAEERGKNKWANAFTLGINWLSSKGVEGVGYATAYFLSLPMQEKKRELEEAKNKLKSENLQQSVEDYQKMIERFESFTKIIEGK